MNQLTDEVCLVTGATRGIGRAIALALGAAGGVVVGTATTTDGAAAVKRYLADAGVSGDGIALDVTDAAAVTAAVTAVTDAFGAPTVLVNNAGITRDGLLLRMGDADWDAVLDTNLKSVYRLSRAVLRAMSKARRGRIVNIASVVASLGSPGQANYAAAKAGMLGFTKSLAAEVASRNITVNAVAPGFIQTDMTAALTDAQRAGLLAKVPLARLGTPDEVAAAVAFLASPAAAYITGATLHINGGMLMA